MNQSQPIPYEPRVVAFIDILGFGTLVGKLRPDPQLHRKLFRALSEIKIYKKLAGDPKTAQKEIEVSVFSDSIVISATPENQYSVIWSALGLQSRLLSLGILCRGGIAKGFTYHKDDMLYGEGMLQAYHLESKTAIYPRIVISPDILPDVSPYEKAAFLSQDVDGLWHTDPFAIGILPGNSEALLEDGWDPHMVFLESFAKVIDREIAEAKEVAHQSKWQWMKSKFEEAFDYQKKHRAPRMWHLRELIAKKMKEAPKQSEDKN
jgi:hypothetical protein